MSNVIVGADPDKPLDLLLVNSPLKDYDKRPRLNDFTLPSIGLGYIATVAASAGFNVGLLDAEAHGLGIARTAELVNAASPRWVGCNLLAPTYAVAVSILQGLHPEIMVMLGGHHAKAMPIRITRDRAIPRLDALVVGEAENRVVELLADVDSRAALPGVYWRAGGYEVRLSDSPRPDPELTAPNLEAMPFVNRDFLAQDPYLDGKVLESAMVASRGCPFDCSFCGAASSVNPDVSVRARSPENIIGEISKLRVQLGVNRIRFIDDLFLANRRLMRETLAAFVEARLELRWDATGRINVLHAADESLLDLLRDAGCREVALGIESGSDRLLRHVDKHISVAQIRAVTRRLWEQGISVKGYFILGLPTETEEDHRATLRLIRDLWAAADALGGLFRASVFEYRPYPGTPDWIRLIASGFPEDAMLAYDDSPTGLVDVNQLANRDEFNFSTGIQFGEVGVAAVRASVATIMQEQRERL